MIRQMHIFFHQLFDIKSFSRETFKTTAIFKFYERIYINNFTFDWQVEHNKCIECFPKQINQLLFLI